RTAARFLTVVLMRACLPEALGAAEEFMDPVCAAEHTTRGRGSGMWGEAPERSRKPGATGAGK
ncbi:MAG: hypothetical protein ABWX63_04600, partial [Paeniglutamicibacter terrestris]